MQSGWQVAQPRSKEHRWVSFVRTIYNCSCIHPYFKRRGFENEHFCCGAKMLQMPLFVKNRNMDNCDVCYWEEEKTLVSGD